MSKHTPGPWEAGNGEVTTQQIEGRSFRRIAAVQDYGMGCLPEVDEANAHLIAAAPDLLESLRRLLDCCELNLDEMEPETLLRIYEARAAIAKAEGQ